MASGVGSWLRAAALGGVTGSRACLGPALVAGRARSRWLRRAAYLAAAIELFMDKTSLLPNRTAPTLLAARIVSGAGVARTAMARRGRAAAGAALVLGAAAAIAGAFAGLRFRSAVTRRLGGGAVASALAGTIEDVALIAVGRRLARPAAAR